MPPRRGTCRGADRYPPEEERAQGPPPAITPRRHGGRHTKLDVVI
jgi:hypothetical protein